MTTYDLELERTGRGDEVMPNWSKGPQNFGWWGMVWLIGTEALMFGSLIASYWYIRYKFGPVWPPLDYPIPELHLPLLMSAILWTSSIPVHLAEQGIKKGNQAQLRIGLAIAWILGAAFLVLQGAVEYPEKMRVHPPTENVYGSLFFAITGLHGAHVGIGLIISAWVQIRAWLGHFSEKRHVTVQNFVMYWHFVDLVWVAVLSSLYLGPNFV